MALASGIAAAATGIEIDSSACFVHHPVASPEGEPFRARLLAGAGAFKSMSLALPLRAFGSFGSVYATASFESAASTVPSSTSTSGRSLYWAFIRSNTHAACAGSSDAAFKPPTKDVSSSTVPLRAVPSDAPRSAAFNSSEI